MGATEGSLLRKIISVTWLFLTASDKTYIFVCFTQVLVSSLFLPFKNRPSDAPHCKNTVVSCKFATISTRFLTLHFAICVTSLPFVSHPCHLRHILVNCITCHLRHILVICVTSLSFASHPCHLRDILVICVTSLSFTSHPCHLRYTLVICVTSLSIASHVICVTFLSFA